jgi:hypothetical protein
MQTFHAMQGLLIRVMITILRDAMKPWRKAQALLVDKPVHIEMVAKSPSCAPPPSCRQDPRGSVACFAVGEDYDNDTPYLPAITD